MLLYVTLILLALQLESIQGFVSLSSSSTMRPSSSAPLDHQRRPHYHPHRPSSELTAVKKKKGGVPKKTTSGGGFGAAPAATVTSSGISGQSGSGSKVLRKAANNFDRLRKDYDVQSCCRDVYVRSPLNSESTFWFVGKIARVPRCETTTPQPSQEEEEPDATEAEFQHFCQAAVAQKRLILDYSKDQLRPESTFWFVGKIARVPRCETTTPRPSEESDATQAEFQHFCQAAVAQKRLILDYSKDQLRPQNLGGKYASTLEVWLAPADSEMDAATNKISLQKVTGRASDLPTTWDPNHVGYNPEIYIGDEVTKGGLRVERDENGHPTKKAFDVNQSM
eukprot:CAMPEP_0172474914 /NCGR_PEP_ID=MMETSP1065-20121228/69602_1 /TAXON_ID=265537 /ORGANISM="Amphiprora paludosa, Strain CCMP125" /LENGTH=336 /DNA_ID=CAMNT_0013233107 /DNA_START=60 /DNA_END=1070 /DNA_ORIENTATION=-